MVWAALLCLPSLAVGFLMDDFLFLRHLDAGEQGSQIPWWDLYVLVGPGEAAQRAARATGIVPWWASPDLRIAFLRPLSSGLLAAERGLFGDRAWLFHLDAVVAYLGLVAACWSLYRRTLTAPVAALALFIFAVDDAHAMPIGWLANRHAVLSWLGVTLGLVAHVRWREDGWTPGSVLAPVGLIAGLAAGESAVGGLGYLFAYEAIAGRGTFARRATALLPAAGVAILYIALYVALERGTSGSELYLHPLRQPAAFAAALPGRAAGLLAGGLLGIPVVLWVAVASARPVLIGLGLVGVTFVAWVLRAGWERIEPGDRRSIAWLGTGALLSLAPVTATFPLDRLLLGTGIGLAPILAVAIRLGRSAWRREWNGPGRLATAALGRWLSLVHVILAPLFLLAMLSGQVALGQQTRAIALEAELDEAGPNSDVVVVWAPDFDTGMYVPAVRQVLGHPPPRSFFTLSVVWHDVQVTRPDANTLEIEVRDGHFLSNLYEELFRRRDQPLPPHIANPEGPFDVEVVARDGDRPTRIAFRFRRSLDAPGTVFLVWKDGRLRRFEPPPVGESVDVAFEPATGLAG